MTSTTVKRVGVAGCGAMGLPMARALLAAGFTVTGFDVRPFAEFGTFAEHMSAAPEGLAQHDVLLCVVRSSRQILDLCFDDQAVYQRAGYPPLLIISSTVSPRFIAQLRERLPADVALIDAPMSGAPFSAERASLSFMLGGAQADIARCWPLFHAMGDANKLFHVGELGQGMAAKVFNNYVAAAGVVAVRQAQAQALKWGLAPERLREIMQHSSGATWYGDHFDEIDWAGEGYAPDNTIGILIKDVSAALDAINSDSNPDGETAEAFGQAVLAALKRFTVIH